jgi:hypothetical protein
MTIDITGGRHRKPTPEEVQTFWMLWYRLRGTKLVHGDYEDPNGTDQYIGRLVKERGFPVEPVPVDHAQDGPWPGAGPRRNRRKLRTHRPGALIAFPGNTGTADNIRAARELEMPVYSVAEHVREWLDWKGEW